MLEVSVVVHFDVCFFSQGRHNEGMTERKSFPVLAILAILPLVLVPVLYIVGYFVLGRYKVIPPLGVKVEGVAWVRQYPNEFLMTIYEPMTIVESKLTGQYGSAGYSRAP